MYFALCYCKRLKGLTSGAVFKLKGKDRNLPINIVGLTTVFLSFRLKGFAWSKANNKEVAISFIT